MSRNTFQEFTDFPKKYFDINFEYGFVKCNDCNWSPEYPHSHIENINMYKTCQYINSKYNITFDEETGEKIGSIKPEKLNLTCPICLDEKYCVEGYFDCEHHVCKDCYSLMKSTEPIKLHHDDDDDDDDDDNDNDDDDDDDNFDFYPRPRYQTEQFNQDYIIIHCPLCRSE